MIPIQLSEVPRLRNPARMKLDQARNTDLLLLPERVIDLNPTAGAILWLCDGQRTVANIVEELETRYEETNLEADILEFLGKAIDKGWVELWR